MNEFFTTGIGILVLILLLFNLILWTFLPFAIFGIKKRLDIQINLLKSTKKTKIPTTKQQKEPEINPYSKVMTKIPTTKQKEPEINPLSPEKTLWGNGNPITLNE